MNKAKKQSEIMSAIYETAKGLLDAGVITKEQFDEIIGRK